MTRSNLPDRLGGLSVQQLDSFCRMCEHLSFAATARELRLAIPTVWEQIKALERSYGVALFEKQGRSMRATPAALELRAIVEPLVTRLESSLEKLSEQRSTVPAQITVTGGVRLLIEDFGEALRQLRVLYPTTRVRLIAADGGSAQSLVLAGSADIAFTLAPPPDQQDTGLHYETSHEIDYLAVFPKRHRLTKSPQVRLKDLIREPLIVGHSETVGRRLLEQAFLREKLLDRMNVSIETDNSAMTIACVHSKLGVGVVGGRHQGPLMKQLAFASLRKELGTAEIVSMTRKGRLLSEPVETLKRILSELNA